MTVLLESSRYCVERAKEHVANFERQLTEFFATNPYGHIVEVDSDTGYEFHKIKLIKPMPVVLPGIAFDAICNLRSALDQSVYSIATLSGKVIDTAFFPFSADAARFESGIRGRCKDLPKEIVDLIRTFKPYKGGDNLLWALNKLVNTNKHAIIRPVATVVGPVVINRLVMSGAGIGVAIPRWDRAKDEMILFRIRPGGKIEQDFEVAPFIAICDIEFVDGKPADAILNEFVRIVEGIVMSIEAEANRIGL